MKTKKQKFEITLIKMIGIMILGALFMCLIESTASETFEIAEKSTKTTNYSTAVNK